jgi:hypothetical protein
MQADVPDNDDQPISVPNAGKDHFARGSGEHRIAVGARVVDTEMLPMLLQDRMRPQTKPTDNLPCRGM